LPAADALPCHVGVLLFRKRIEHLWTGWVTFNYSLWRVTNKYAKTQKKPYLHCGAPGYDKLLLTGGCRRFGGNVYPFLQGVQLKSWPLTKPWIFHVTCYL
jgi:hypothetical protein